MTRYWVYENRTRKRARLHCSECLACNDGKGRRPEDSGRDGRWNGPFADRSAALKALRASGLADRAICGLCASQKSN